MNNAKHSSSSYEHYTPEWILDPARQVLRHIDLDPASCAEANLRVRAESYYDEASDGLERSWHGKIWLNPPGGLDENRKSRVQLWWRKLAYEYFMKRVEEAIFFGFSVECLQSCQKLFPACDRKDDHVCQGDRVGLLRPTDCIICIPNRRVPHYAPGGKLGKQPTHASCLIYMGPNDSAFAGAFRHVGAILEPWGWS